MSHDGRPDRRNSRDNTPPTLQDLDDRLSDHFVDDGVRFKSIDDKLEALLTVQEEQVKSFEAHKAKVEPYLQGAAGFGIIWKFFVAVGGAVLLWFQLKNFFSP